MRETDPRPPNRLFECLNCKRGRLAYDFFVIGNFERELKTHKLYFEVFNFFWLKEEREL